ncbi:MAG: universal stress protein [Pirellulaceae bacterium]
MHLVLALDDSADAQNAVGLLSRLPFRQKPKVTMVTALLDFPLEHVTTDTGVTLREAEREEASQLFERAKQQLATSCSDFEHVIEREHPSRLIYEVAKQREADLVALGARGHSAAYRTLLGSTADYIVNHAKCSVLVVRNAADRPPPPAPLDFYTLIAYDGSPHAHVAAAQAQQFDWPNNRSQVHISMMLLRPKLIPDDVVYDPQRISESEKAIGEMKSVSSFSCPVTHSIHETLHIGNALWSKVEKENFNLVFVGSSNKSAVSRMFLGSTSRYLLHHSPTSVWIAREKHWR